MAGPVFQREIQTAPKRGKFFLGRTLFAFALLVLICTGYLVVAGTQPLRSSADLARFGGWMFQLLAPLQITVLTFQAALQATSTVAMEKDRRTLILLLLTRISGSELVVGKWTAGLIGPVTMLIAAAPVFMALTLFGGVSPVQVLWIEAITLAAICAAAALGVTVALWREKTFQSVAVTVLALVLWLTLCELVLAGVVPGVPRQLGLWGSSYRALGYAAAPLTAAEQGLTGVLGIHLAWMTTAAVVALIVGATQLRRWNPSRELRIVAAAAEGETDERSASWKVREARAVWNNPVLWREMRTWAYGRRVLMIRAAYVLFFAVSAIAVIQAAAGESRTATIEGTIPPGALAFAPLMVVSLVIVNALAVSSIVTERDVLAIDLLLVSDMSPREFIFGKLGGVLYVAKEIWMLPMGLMVACWWLNLLSSQNLMFSLLGGVVLYAFAATLGLHCGLNYANGRSALLTSLGTIFFLCLGIAACMVMMVGFRGSFGLQLAPFLAVIVGGGAGIYAALGWRRPSSALLSASFGLPFLTFYAITAFLMRRDQLPVAFAVLVAYGFATAAMLVPSVSEFDVAMGRTRSGGDEAG